MNCPSCGAKVSENDKYCNKCGKVLNQRVNNKIKQLEGKGEIEDLTCEICGESLYGSVWSLKSLDENAKNEEVDSFKTENTYRQYRKALRVVNVGMRSAGQSIIRN